MPSALEVSQKIQSLTNIQKVTGAMNLIASIRHRKLAAGFRALKRFDGELTSWLNSVIPILVREEGSEARTPPSPRMLALAFTSDRGLCGSHNHAVNRALDTLAETARSTGQAFQVACVGSRGAAHSRRRGYEVLMQAESKGLEPNSAAMAALADTIIARVLRGENDTLALLYNRYVSTLRQVTETRVVWPLDRLAASPGTEPELDRSEAFGQEAKSMALKDLIALALAHSRLSEQAARMTAMDNASKNARELTARAVQERNRLRQAGITTELIEIVSGKEAMKR